MQLSPSDHHMQERGLQKRAELGVSAEFWPLALNRLLRSAVLWERRSQSEMRARAGAPVLFERERQKERFSNLQHTLKERVLWERRSERRSSFEERNKSAALILKWERGQERRSLF